MLDHTTCCHFLVRHTERLTMYAVRLSRTFRQRDTVMAPVPIPANLGGNGTVSLRASAGVLFPLGTK